MSQRISRRTALKGLGTTIGLPMLEAMAPAAVLAAGGDVAAAARPAPKRMAYIYIPNGVNMEHWTPSAVGQDFKLPYTLEPLAPFKQELLVLSGLTCDKARPHGDGPGDHARAMSAFLTGAQPKKTSGADIKVGISVDQVAAQKVGDKTRFPSLELGCDRGLNSGNCDSGYSCAYSANISWRSATTPMAKEINPRLVFDRLFAGEVKGEAQSARAKRERYRLSVLDFVLEDASQLKSRLGTKDQQKMDEYLSAVREIELRIAKASGAPGSAGPAGMVMPAGIPNEYADHIRIMSDLLVLAFQGDLTRIATFIYANDGSNRSYRNIGVSDGHHDISHHGGNKEKLLKLREINRFHVQQLAYLLGRLKSIKEGEGTLLDHCMLVYGGGIGDGNRHNHDNLPILFAGRGDNTIKTGQHVKVPKETPLANLFVSMLNRMGVAEKSFGDSKGDLDQLIKA
jgi:hypothetical protein